MPYLHEDGERGVVGVIDEHGPEKDEDEDGSDARIFGEYAYCEHLG